MGSWLCVASDGEVPRSVSRVVLRVGARLQLRCAPGVLSWAKDGLSLRDGYKYNIHNTLLTVRHTGTIDTLSLSTPHLLSLFSPPLPSSQEWLSTVAEWLACWTQAQKGLGSNRSRNVVG